MTCYFVMFMQYQKTFYILLANDNRTTLDKSNDIDAKNKLTHDSVKKTSAKTTNVDIDYLNINCITSYTTIIFVLSSTYTYMPTELLSANNENMSVVPVL